ncbi:MAG TPA: hypothetical protein VIH90_04330 [Candidatus Saccharimonadales bacterium]
MIKRLNSAVIKVKALWLVPLLSILTLSLSGAITPAVSSAQGLPVASCVITDIPATPIDGTYVTPTVVVTNNGTKTFTTTVNVMEGSYNKSGGRGGEAEGTVTVAPGQNAQFQGGSLLAQSGYKIKMVAKSVGKPHFSCKVVTAKVE